MAELENSPQDAPENPQMPEQSQPEETPPTKRDIDGYDWSAVWANQDSYFLGDNS
jgi:hypothetical protein